MDRTTGPPGNNLDLTARQPDPKIVPPRKRAKAYRIVR
jgi:hypothetical protein